MPRRVFLVAPFAFTGLIALFHRKERRLPDPSANGVGPVVSIVLFDSRSKPTVPVLLRKIVKSDADWRAELWSDEYNITRKGGTEIAYTGRYWKAHEAGLYRCTDCGTAVFRSSEKFDSETGWPSFWAPAAEENVWTKKDMSLGFARLEVLCRKCDAHLGHLFSDGPQPAGLRYCINSAALRFQRALTV